MLPAKRRGSFAEKDANKDGKVSTTEYVAHFMAGLDLKNKNGLVNRIGGRFHAREVAQVHDIARFRSLRMS